MHILREILIAILGTLVLIGFFSRLWFKSKNHRW